jgi:hypothetical protein
MSANSALIDLIIEVNQTNVHVPISIERLANLVHGEPRVYGHTFGWSESGEKAYFLKFAKTADGWTITGKINVVEFINVRIPTGGKPQETRTLDPNSGDPITFLVTDDQQFVIKGYMLQQTYKSHAMPLLTIPVRRGDKEGKMFLYLRGE